MLMLEIYYARASPPLPSLDIIIRATTETLPETLRASISIAHLEQDHFPHISAVPIRLPIIDQMAIVKVANRGIARHLLPKARAVSTSAVISQTAVGHSMPPGFTAKVGRLETFTLPERVSGSVSDKAIADAMIGAWRRDGILQIGMTKSQQRVYQAASATSRRFFAQPHARKEACVDGSSYSGYIASGEEITDGVADYSEIFTVTKDLPHTDKRVAQGWPCHGPCPWLDQEMKAVMNKYMEDLAVSGEKLLQLIEMGLDIPTGSLTKYTADGWHHMRVLR
jgi:hypothetical protein